MLLRILALEALLALCVADSLKEWTLPLEYSVAGRQGEHPVNVKFVDIAYGKFFEFTAKDETKISNFITATSSKSFIELNPPALELSLRKFKVEPPGSRA